MEYSEELAWIWLTRIGRPINTIIAVLLNEYKDIKNIWDIRNSSDLSADILKFKSACLRLTDERLKEEAYKIFSKVKMIGMKTVTYSSDDYPTELRRIYDRPPILYYFGKLPTQYNGNMDMLSVVGSRRCSSYGRCESYRFSRKLAECGVGIISGMARGVDTEAHKGALDADGYTACILGCGCDIVYPPENIGLYNRIKENGCIIAEYPPGTEPLKNHFPARNRIIAGMTKGTLVIEAGKRSGALITVERAMEENRSVYALPGNVNIPESEGCNMLIKQGAMCVTSYTDILEDMGIEAVKSIVGNPGWTNGLNKREACVVRCIYEGLTSTDAIAERIMRSKSEIESIMTVLELKGIVSKIDENEYCLRM